MTTVRKLARDQYAHWDAFVDTSPQGSLYAKTWYLDALQAPYEIVALERGEAIIGGIVLPRNEIGHTANPMLVKYLGILFGPPQATVQDTQDAEFEAMRELVPALQEYPTFDCTFHPAFTNWLPLYWAGFRQEIRYTFRITDLSSRTHIWDSMHAKARSAIRRAERDNVRVDVHTSPEQLFDLVDQTFRRQGGSAPIRRETILHYAQSLMPSQHLQILGARNTAGELTAACAIAYDDRSANLVLNGLNDTLCGPGDNLLLLWTAIEFSLTASRLFDFEGSMLQPIAHVYRRLGGQITAYHNIWNPSLRTTAKRWAIPLYKKIRYGR